VILVTLAGNQEQPDGRQKLRPHHAHTHTPTRPCCAAIPASGRWWKHRRRSGRSRSEAAAQDRQGVPELRQEGPTKLMIKASTSQVRVGGSSGFAIVPVTIDFDSRRERIADIEEVEPAEIAIVRVEKPNAVLA
jgi:hypothetical protein